MKKGMFPKGRFFRRLILLAAFAAAGYGLFRIGRKAAEYMENAGFYNALRREVTLVRHDGNTLSEADERDRKSPSRRTSLKATAEGEESFLEINWETLKGTDIVGWLELYDADYPILQAEDNAYYLHRLPDGTVNYGGSIFLNASSDAGFKDRNSFVYGHSMADGSMFGTLYRYLDPDYGCGEFRIYYPDGGMDAFRILSAAVTDKNSRAYDITFDTEEEFTEYQEYMKSISCVKSAVQPDPDARLVTLSTCFGMLGTEERLLITGLCSG